MNYKPTSRKFGWASRLAIVAVAAFLLPMDPGGEQPTALADKPVERGAAEGDIAPIPRIVKTAPRQGATGVDAALNEITVSFDREMGPGMSWTGGPPLFPPIDKSREPRWTDARTCVLPVKLEPGSYYRVGVNSSSFGNFRSQQGVAANAAAIYFTTKGAGKEVDARVRVPAIRAIEPKNGADDVDPATTSLRVTFSMPMSEGMSWTGGGPLFPKTRDGESAKWSDDGLTCSLPVTLEPDHDYELGINSPRYNNFQSKWGVPLEAVTYRFRTRR